MVMVMGWVPGIWEREDAGNKVQGTSAVVRDSRLGGRCKGMAWVPSEWYIQALSEVTLRYVWRRVVLCGESGDVSVSDKGRDLRCCVV